MHQTIVPLVRPSNETTRKILGDIHIWDTKIEEKKKEKKKRPAEQTEKEMPAAVG